MVRKDISVYMLKTYIEELQYISKSESLKKYFDAQFETNQGSLET